jgi:hypothetical protein
MILLEIDAACLAIVEFEGDAPRPVDMDGEALWIEAVQCVKVEAGNVHFFRSHSDIETIQPDQNALLHLGVDFRAPAEAPEVGQRLASEASDHAANVSEQLTPSSVVAL